MKKKLKKLLEKKELSCIYYDEKETDIFLIGWVVAIDREFFIIECVNAKGFNNGFSCRLIDSIIKIESNSNYVKSIEKLWNFHNQKQSDIILESSNCKKTLLDHLSKKEKICFIELCESYSLDSVGFVSNFDKDLIEICRINDCGEPEGQETLSYEKISAITMGNEEQLRLENLAILSKLHKFQT